MDNTEPFIVKSVSDIKKAIEPFFRKGEKTKTDIKTDIQWVDEGPTVSKKYKTSVTSYVEDANVKDIIVDAINSLAQQQKAFDSLADALEDDEFGPTLPRIDIKHIYSPVDNFIRHRMGGVRDGLVIVWVLGDKKWVFNPLNNELKDEPNA